MTSSERPLPKEKSQWPYLNTDCLLGDPQYLLSNTSSRTMNISHETRHAKTLSSKFSLAFLFWEDSTRYLLLLDHAQSDSSPSIKQIQDSIYPLRSSPPHGMAFWLFLMPSTKPSSRPTQLIIFLSLTPYATSHKCRQNIDHSRHMINPEQIPQWYQLSPAKRLI